MANPFLFPQTSSAPIASGTIRDEQEALKTAEGDATSSQRVIAIGSAIPVVFGKFADRKGGVWANPVAGRMGLQLSDTQDNAFSFGMVVSDGKIGPIADEDIYKGTFPLSALKNPVAVNSYSAMPEDGFNYTFSSTTTTPGQPGTPDETVTTDTSTRSTCRTIPICWYEGQYRAVLDQQLNFGQPDLVSNNVNGRFCAV